MTATRSRKQAKAYQNHRDQYDTDGCAFCKLDIAKDKQVIAITPSFKIIHNLFPYSIWDSERVVDHLMIVPTKHTDTLKDLSPTEAAEFVQLIAKYEDQGYNVYARAPGSAIKTVVHQHTHLIKTAGHVRFVFTLAKPYIRWFR